MLYTFRLIFFILIIILIIIVFRNFHYFRYECRWFTVTVPCRLLLLVITASPYEEISHGPMEGQYPNQDQQDEGLKRKAASVSSV
jgi:hypothetical protein